MITQDGWDHLSDGARIDRVRSLARTLPVGFEPVGLRDFALGAASHRLAELRRGDERFVLIPGGERSVGYDVEREWQPDPGERESWEASAAEYGIADSLSAHLARVLLRRRRVVVPPLLVEVEAREAGFQRIDASDPSVADLVREHAGRHGTTTVHRGGPPVRIQSRPDGPPVVEVAVRETHAEIVAGLAREGFRPPTSEEWEYLCGAGTETVFRWGDHAPTDRYPVDVSPEEAAWRREWVLSAGTLPYPEEGFRWGFDLHRRPNALGLQIASNPYRYELTTDPRVRRGGDGGCAVCGGVGYFLAWLTLATAYFEPEVAAPIRTRPSTRGTRTCGAAFRSPDCSSGSRVTVGERRSHLPSAATRAGGSISPARG